MTQDHAARFIASYRNYCWLVEKVQDLKLAPFHILYRGMGSHRPGALLAHGQVGRSCRSSSRSAHRDLPVDVSAPASEEAAIEWWEKLTASGGEGMVVKPSEFVAKGRRGLVQPAVKCRGVEYFRIIYGPDYTVPENLDRFRQRGLGAKRSLAMREFALGAERLERFVRNEPLRRVHECVFAVLALESEPVDSRP